MEKRRQVVYRGRRQPALYRRDSLDWKDWLMITFILAVILILLGALTEGLEFAPNSDDNSKDIEWRTETPPKLQ